MADEITAFLSTTDVAARDERTHGGAAVGIADDVAHVADMRLWAGCAVRVVGRVVVVAGGRAVGGTAVTMLVDVKAVGGVWRQSLHVAFDAHAAVGRKERELPVDAACSERREHRRGGWLPSSSLVRHRGPLISRPRVLGVDLGTGDG